MKKEVSDHLSHAFFERRTLKKQKKKSLGPLIVTGCGAIVLIFVFFLWNRVEGKRFFAAGRDLTLENHEGPYASDFDFTDSSSKIRVVTIDLGMMDAHQYESVTFSVRMPSNSTRQANSIKVSLVNKRNEISSLYISDINNSWKKITIPFSKFSHIHDWTNLAKLSFILEEWNVLPKNGRLLVDEIGFTKRRLPNFN